MRLSVFATMVALAALAETRIAHADWLDDAWSEDSVRVNGNPAITIRSDFIYVVLPTATLRQAYDEGVTMEDALRAFVGRYGQRCSSLIDLNVPHPHLKIRLSWQGQARLNEIAEKDEALAALRDAYLRQRIGDNVPSLFTVSPGHLDFTIDYVPTNRVRCIAPEPPTS
jgi:hypothetical protein